MGGKTKGKVYGKRPKPHDTNLAEAFNTLSLSDDSRSPLADRSVNAPKTVPLSPQVINLDYKSTETLVTPTSRRTPLQDTSPKATPTKQYKASPEVATAVPQRKLRSIRRATSKGADHQIRDETTYLSPLTAIPDVEAVVQQFDLWAQTMDKLLDIEMIGEGSYANVFKLSSKTDPLDYSITKLIPLRPRRGSGSRSPDLTTVENAASEIQVLAKLSGVTGFTDFKRAMLLRGQLPKSFRDACKTFDKKRKENVASRQESERKCRTNYPKPQIWLFVEMGDAGEELEQILLRGFDSRLDHTSKQDDTVSQKPCLTVLQTRDIFYCTVEALALGEHEALFEHRDLHLSNVCVKRLETDRDIRETSLDWQLVPSSSAFAVTLIDYTLSRADTAEGTVFNPMDDEGLFGGEGNFQYDIYRYMRKAVIGSSTADWSTFVPGTNVLWLHYVLRRLLENTILTKGIRSQAKELLLVRSLEQIKRDTDPQQHTSHEHSSATDLLVYMEVQSES